MDADATAVRSLCSNRDEQEHDKIVSNEQKHEKIIMKDAASTIAIFKDGEKDLSDPDYNRSYDRYSRGFIPCHDFNLGACNVLQPSYLQISGWCSSLQPVSSDSYFCHSCMPSNSLAPSCAVGCNQTSPDSVYMQRPSPAMVCAHTCMVISGMPYSRQQSISNLATIELDRWQNRQITELYPPLCR